MLEFERVPLPVRPIHMQSLIKLRLPIEINNPAIGAINLNNARFAPFGAASIQVFGAFLALDHSVFQTRNFKKEDLVRWDIHAYRSFYLRFHYFLKRIKKSLSFSEMKINVKGLRMFLEMTRG